MGIKDLYLAPVPKRISERQGVFNTVGKKYIQLKAANPQSITPAAKKSGLKWEVTASPKAPKADVGLIIHLDESAGIPAQGYKLTVNPDRIEIAASDAAGAFYGACTLAQILQQANDDAIPCLSISDQPDLPARGVMLDISRDKVPTMDTLYHLVDLLANWKINQLQLYTEHTFAYLAHPAVWEKASPMTGEEILVLDAYCKERFIELVPNQNSFGHMERWLRHDEYRPLAEVPSDRPFSICPIDKRSIKFLSGLYDELLPHFSSSLFNVGLDETFDLGKGRSKKICEEHGTGRVYLNFLLEIYNAVKEHGRTMMFWGDIIMNHPELITELPDDLIALEWGYEFDHPFSEHGKKFKDSEIPFYVCPGTSTWNSIAGRTENTIGNITNAAKNGHELGAIGLLNTDWGDSGHWQPLSASYLGFMVGAMASWNTKSNVKQNLAENLSYNAFGDKTGKTGKAFYDIGDVYRVFKSRTRNSSVPWQTLFRPGPKLLEIVQRKEYEEMASRLEEIAKEVDGGEVTSPDAAIVGQELEHLLSIMRFSADVGKMVTGGPEVKNLEELTSEIKKDHKRIWRLRNRPGGLSDSTNRLKTPQKSWK